MQEAPSIAVGGGLAPNQGHFNFSAARGRPGPKVTLVLPPGHRAQIPLPYPRPGTNARRVVPDPGIVSVLEFANDRIGPLMVLDYVHGRDLAAWHRFIRATQATLPVEVAVHASVVGL